MLYHAYFFFLVKLLGFPGIKSSLIFCMFSLPWSYHQVIPELLSIMYKFLLSLLKHIIYLITFILKKSVFLVLLTCSNLSWLFSRTAKLLIFPLSSWGFPLFALIPRAHVFSFPGLLPYFDGAPLLALFWERVCERQTFYDAACLKIVLFVRVT